MPVLYSLVLPLLVATWGYCIWRAIAVARTPQGAVGWVIFLISAPWFAVPSFAIFGNHKLRDYNAARREAQEQLARLDVVRRMTPGRPDPANRMSVYEQLAEAPTLTGNSARLLIDGEATFDAIFAAIDAAQDYVCVQYYTIEEDAVGTALADCLIAAAARGVTVRVAYDGAGSYRLSRRWVARLREAGVKVLDPHAARGPNSRLNINFRNHRKTVIVDGRDGFTGGVNMADTYLDGGTAFAHWRDTHLHLRGPIVAQLQLAFLEDWYWASNQFPGEQLFWDPPPEKEDLAGLILSAGPNDALDTGALFFMEALSQARSRIWIASPYFVPDAAALAALMNAALRGCDVRVIMPDAADHFLTWLAAFDYLDDVRATGAKIYRYRPGFAHQKVVLVDDDIAAVGTMNFDCRSFRLNFETMAIFHDTGFVAAVEEMLEADMARCELLQTSLCERPWPVRVSAPLARLFAPVL